MSWIESFSKNFKKRKGKNFKELFLSRNYFKNRREDLYKTLTHEVNETQTQLEKTESHAMQDFLASKMRPSRKIIKQMNAGKLTEEDEKELHLRMFDIYSKLNERRKKVAEREEKRGGEKYKKDKVVDLEYAVNYLIGMGILSKDKKIRESQKKSLKPWVDYFKINDYDFRFIKLVLGSIMTYSTGWNPRKNNDSVDFPTFPSNGPAILGKLYTFYSEMNSQNGNIYRALERLWLNPEDAINLQDKNFKDLFLFFQRKELLSKEFLSQAETVPGSGKWQKKFTFKNDDGSPKSETDKNKVASELAELCDSTFELCLKGFGKAWEYLDSGDIEIFTVTKKGIKDDKEVYFEVPEIAIHIKRISKNGKEKLRINEQEVHGNGPNQAINPEYLPVIKSWVEKSEFENKDEILLKVADAEMLARLEEKINSLENGGPDLEPNELKFLYEIYRTAKLFVLNSQLDGTMENLRTKRYRILLNRNQSYVQGTMREQVDLLENQRKKDYAKMFGTESIMNLGMPIKLQHFEKYGKSKVVVGLVSVTNEDLDVLSETEEITGRLYLTSTIQTDSVNGYNEMLDKLHKLKKVNGIEITKEDKMRLLLPENYMFPTDNDPRLKRIFY